jgi:uncharacterized protein YqgC (DUF456 family)
MMIDGVLIILSGILMVAGIIGCILPVLPGPPLSYTGLLLLQLSSKHPFTAQFLILYAILTVLVTVLDFVIPVYCTKRFKGSKYGVIGCAVGLILGVFFFPPLGIIIGPVIGAFIGELLMNKASDKAIKSAIGSFLGFLGSTSIKLILTLTMAYHFVMNVF